MAESKTTTAGGEEREKSCWQCGRTFVTTLEVCPDDGARLIATGIDERDDPLLGTLFDGRFEILEKLGEGGMGSVYSAKRLDFETTVALKLLKADFARDEGIRKRFMYEARVISNLKHPHAVRLFDFGQTSDGHVYMVMELLNGESLADRLAYRFVSYREVFEIIPPICGVLGEAHLREVIHRDLKPENIYLLKVDGNKEFPKLIDFGIAKHNRAETMTKSGTLWGTPAYMSPEQARGDAVEASADIYAMGIMLYELISGNLPLQATTQMGFAVKHINEEARPLSSIPGLKSVPEELDRYILSMLAKRPEDRPSSMEEVAQTLLRIQEEHFSEALLDSIPAEEVDPIGLQAWMKEAPDISRDIPAERDNATVDVANESERLTMASGELGDQPSSGSLDETLAGTPIDVIATREEDRRAEELSGGNARGVYVSGAIGAVLAFALAIWFFTSGTEEVVHEARVEESSLNAPPQSTEAVVGAATIRAAHVVFEARGMVQRIGAVDQQEMGEQDFDFLNVPSRGAEERRTAPTMPDEDKRLREALEQTF